jgi:3-keto-disaccharide hydrolase
MRKHVNTWGWTALLVGIVALAIGGCGGDVGEPPPADTPDAKSAEPAQPRDAGSEAKSGSEAKTCCPAGAEKACCPAAKKCVVLFDGTDLSSWQNARDAAAESKWTIEDGAMTNEPHGTDIATKESYKDFCLCLEYKTVKDGNSGVYLRGRIEVQVFDSHGKEEVGDADNGAIFGQTPPLVNASKPAGEWNTLMACYKGDTLSVMLNGQKVHDKLKVTGLTGGALEGGVNDPGPLMLQGDHGKVWYRNIRLCPLAEGEECAMGPECPLMKGGECCPAAKEGGSDKKEDGEDAEEGEGFSLGGDDDSDGFDYSKGGGSKSTPPK